MLSQVVLLALVVLCSSYNVTLAGEMARASKLAELPKGLLTSPNCSQCKDWLSNIAFVQAPSKKLQGFVAYSTASSCIVVALRGTKQAENWKINLKVGTTKYNCSSCKVHSGFNEAAKVLYPMVSKEVGKLQAAMGPLPVVMTGHSLGGALAGLVGLQLRLALNASLSLYTFGAPRIGNKEFCNFASSAIRESYRIVYQRDAIPHMPPKMLGYSHFGTEVWYNSRKEYKECPGDSRERCSNSVSLMLLKKSDHRLGNYLRVFEQAEGLRSAVVVGEGQAEGLEGYQMRSQLVQVVRPEEITEHAN